MNSTFAPHGEGLPNLVGRVLLVRTSGTWNLEQRRRSDEACAPLVARLAASGPWGCVVVPLDTAVTQIEVLNEGAQAIRAATGVGLCAMAWVFASSVEGATVLRATYQRCFGAILPIQFYDDERKALAWVESQVRAAVQAKSHA